MLYVRVHERDPGYFNISINVRPFLLCPPTLLSFILPLPRSVIISPSFTLREGASVGIQFTKQSPARISSAAAVREIEKPSAVTLSRRSDITAAVIVVGSDLRISVILPSSTFTPMRPTLSRFDIIYRAIFLSQTTVQRFEWIIISPIFPRDIPRPSSAPRTSRCARASARLLISRMLIGVSGS